MTAIRLPFLFLIAFLVGADEFLLGPILTPIGDDLGVAPERVTLFIAAYSLPLALLAPVFGFLSDRYGRLAVLLPATAGFAAASVLTGFASSFEWGLATRVLTGIASAGMLPIAFALAADEGEEAAKGISLVMGGLTTGIVVSPGFGALVTDIWSWRAAFIVLGLVALVSALVASAVLRTGNAAPPAVTPADKGKILVPGTAGALCGMFFGIGGAVGIYSLVGERLRDALLLDTHQVGVIYVGFGILSVAGNALAPGAIRRIGGGRQAMRLCIALGLWALLGGIGAPGLQAHIAGLSASRRGVLMALGSSALNLGVAFSAALAGEAYLHNNLWVAGLGAVLLAIAVLALAKPRGTATAAESIPDCLCAVSPVRQQPKCGSHHPAAA